MTGEPRNRSEHERESDEYLTGLVIARDQTFIAEFTQRSCPSRDDLVSRFVGTERKFFNDFLRARVRARGVHPGSAHDESQKLRVELIGSSPSPSSEVAHAAS
jgi:hypothetical protein